MELKTARSLAAEVASYMQPYCERIQLAGSIRREVAEVKDLELVCIPRWGMIDRPRGLFNERVNANLLYEAMRYSEFIRWIKPATSEIQTWPIKAEGKYWRGLIRKGRFDAPEDIKLDLFIARPENYGIIFCIRTGSADFSRALVTHARDRTDYRVENGNLADAAGVVDIRTEAELFSILGLQYVEPRFRRVDSDIRPL